MNQPAAKDDPLRGKKTGKWTKYGGAISGLVKERIQDTWFCQLCSSEIPKELRPFLFELFPGDFIRICNSCTTKAQTIPEEVDIEIVIKQVRIYRD